MRHAASRWASAFALAVLGAVSCGSENDLPAPAETGGGSGKSQGGGGQQAAGGEADDSAAGVGNGATTAQGGQSDLPPLGEVGGAGLIGESGGAPAAVPALCDQQTSWGGAAPLAGISTPGADERLLALTHDEKSLVFARADALFVADRATADVDFGAPVPLTLPVGYSHELGLALSADGLALVVVSADGHAFADVTRASRSGAFGTEPSFARFVDVNDARTFTGGALSSPVLSRDDASFYYAERHAGLAEVWRARGKGHFSSPEAQDRQSFGAVDDKAKLPLSVSADERALFVFDEALEQATGFWRAAAAAGFTEVVHFPGLSSVFTNASCDRLYGTRQVASSLDVVLETPN